MPLKHTLQHPGYTVGLSTYVCIPRRRPLDQALKVHLLPWPCFVRLSFTCSRCVPCCWPNVVNACAALRQTAGHTGTMHSMFHFPV